LKGFPMVNYLFMHHLTRINRRLSDALARARQEFVTGLTGIGQILRVWGRILRTRESGYSDQ